MEAEQQAYPTAYQTLVFCSLATPCVLQIELSTSPMTSAHGIEARGAPRATTGLNPGESGAEQENQHSCKAAPSHDPDRQPLRALPLGRTQYAQRPRPKLPGSLNLTRKLPAPVRKAVTTSENASHAPSEASLLGESSESARCRTRERDPVS